MGRWEYLGEGRCNSDFGCWQAGSGSGCPGPGVWEEDRGPGEVEDERRAYEDEEGRVSEEVGGQGEEEDRFRSSWEGCFGWEY